MSTTTKTQNEHTIAMLPSACRRQLIMMVTKQNVSTCRIQMLPTADRVAISFSHTQAATTGLSRPAQEGIQAYLVVTTRVKPITAVPTRRLHARKARKRNSPFKTTTVPLNFTLYGLEKQGRAVLENEPRLLTEGGWDVQYYLPIASILPS